MLKFLLLTSVPFPFAAFGLSTCVGITLIDVGPTQQIVAATSIVLANVYVPPATVNLGGDDVGIGKIGAVFYLPAARLFGVKCLLVRPVPPPFPHF